MTDQSSSTGSRLENRERWRAHVMAQQGGPFNQREYCEAHDLTFSSFTRWRRLLLGDGKVRPLSDVSAFVPVRIEPAPTTLQEHNGGSLSLVLPNGIQIKGITAASLPTAVALAAAL